jgi:hypothetical protein
MRHSTSIEPKPGDRVVSKRPDGRYDVGDVVMVTEGIDADDRARGYDYIVLLSAGTKGVVVQFDPTEQPPADTFEVACHIARRLLLPDGALWTRRDQTIEPFAP